MNAATASPRRRLRHRVPLPVRHHWKPVAALLAGLTALLVLFGGARVSPFVTSASAGGHEQIVENIAGSMELYDASAAHSIELRYKERDFEKMMEAFTKDGDKEYIEADLTIDGTFIPSVGIRLKGNSTLMSLRQAGGNGAVPGGGLPGGGQGGFPQFPQGQAPQGGTTEGQGQTQGQQGQGQTQGQGQGRQGGGRAQGGAPGGGGPGGMVQLSADRPEELPWLIKIDEYVEGRAYQGHQEISIRPGSNAAVPLNEAVSLSSVDASGQPAQRYAFSSVKVNGSAAAGRLVVENPGQDWASARVGEVTASSCPAAVTAPAGARSGAVVGQRDQRLPAVPSDRNGSDRRSAHRGLQRARLNAARHLATRSWCCQ